MDSSCADSVILQSVAGIINADTGRVCKGRRRQPHVCEGSRRTGYFFGNPNLVWILSEADGVLFLKKLAMLPQASAKELHDDLGYRGFIVEVINETEDSLIRIQNGTVQLSQNDNNVYYSDQNRHLERWLLNSGKPTLRSDLFKIVERDFPENSTNLSYPLK
jgi:hypothetical protein